MFVFEPFLGAQSSQLGSATWEKTSFPGGTPVASLNRQIQVLSKDLSEAKAQLERASRNHRSELSAIASELEAAQAALSRSLSREAQASKDRDKLSAACKQLESDLGFLVQEQDQAGKRTREEEAMRLATQLKPGLSEDHQTFCSSTECQTEPADTPWDQDILRCVFIS